jgi:hypothetical protein
METAQIPRDLSHERAPRSATEAPRASARGALVLIAAAATAVIVPMLFLGNASGHDFQFHLASWLDVAGQWREGIFYPRWAEWSNWGFGEPRFIFYPPGSWMLGAALGSILPWRMAPGAFIWLALVLAGFSMWRLAREWLPEPQARMAAVVFAVNPYHLMIVYYRSDFAELLASAMFPLIVLGAFRASRDGWRRVPTLAVAFAAIWLSNAPAGVIATYSLALLLVVGCVLHRSAQPLVRGGVAMAAGFGLAAFYIFPAAWEQRWVKISQALAVNLRPGDNFLFTHSSDPEFVLFNWKVSAVAVGVILLSAIAAVFAARRRRDFLDAWWMLVVLAAVAVFLMFPPSSPLWNHLPKLQFVQFPWRWLVPLDTVLAFVLAATLGSWRRQWIPWLAIVVVVGALGTAFVRDAWWDSEDIPVLAGGISSGHGYEGTDEYQPLGCDRYQLPGEPPPTADPSDAAASLMDASAPPPTPRIAKLDPESGEVVPATGVRLHVERWDAERRIFSAESAEQATLAVRLLNYPAWEVRVDGAKSHAGSLPETAQMLVQVPSGLRGVRLHFRRTWDRTAGNAISFFFALGLVGFAWAARRKPA